MSARKAIFILGLLLAVVPLSIFGLPQSWKNVFYILAGLGLAIGAVVSYVRSHAPQKPGRP